MFTNSCFAVCHILIHTHPVMMYVSSCSKLLSYKLEQRESARDSHFSSLHDCLRIFCASNKRLDLTHTIVARAGNKVKKILLRHLLLFYICFTMCIAYGFLNKLLKKYQLNYNTKFYRGCKELIIHLLVNADLIIPQL